MQWTWTPPKWIDDFVKDEAEDMEKWSGEKPEGNEQNEQDEQQEDEQNEKEE